MTIPEPPQQKKKGLSPLAWVGIGCLVLIVLGGVGCFAVTAFLTSKAKDVVQGFENEPVTMGAKAFALVNPDIEFVSADEEARTVVFRDVDTGEEMTFDFEDIEQGRVTFESGGKTVTFDAEDSGEGGALTVTTDDGEEVFRAGAMREGDISDWVVRYPDTDIAGTFSSTSGGRRTGAFQQLTTDGVLEVFDYFEQALRDAGFEVSTQKVESDGGFFGIVSGKDAAADRSTTVSVTAEEGQTRIAIQFEGEAE